MFTAAQSKKLANGLVGIYHQLSANGFQVRYDGRVIVYIIQCVYIMFRFLPCQLFFSKPSVFSEEMTGFPLRWTDAAAAVPTGLVDKMFPHGQALVEMCGMWNFETSDQLFCQEPQIPAISLFSGIGGFELGLRRPGVSATDGFILFRCLHGVDSSFSIDIMSAFNIQDGVGCSLSPCRSS